MTRVGALRFVYTTMYQNTLFPRTYNPEPCHYRDLSLLRLQTCKCFNTTKTTKQYIDKTVKLIIPTFGMFNRARSTKF
jgi:hypothetical protein